ncbi:hypothetical protein BDV93DRAFT_506713 [Ceratobasidium sp. AG-I]|nr:hypothetical protein BDV93DRAFT_506713 [Ceratobasidium sp. AG-I]
MSWYRKRPCTTFQSLQHCKKCTGFWHEYIDLQFQDGSICRLERMGDPYARIEALSTHGTTAHDLMQFLQPNELPSAHLDSDIIAEVTFPQPLDLMDVLGVCRAIQEGERTCSYTLLSSNCYFFCLAIQAGLTRLIAQWEVQDPHNSWTDALKECALEIAHTPPLSYPGRPFLPQIYSAFFQLSWPAESLAYKIQNEISAAPPLPRVNLELEKELWYSKLSSKVDLFCENLVKEGIVNAIARDARAHDHDSQTPWLSFSSRDPHCSAVQRCRQTLNQLVALASERHREQTNIKRFGNKQVFRGNSALDFSCLDFVPPATPLPLVPKLSQPAGYSLSNAQCSSFWRARVVTAILWALRYVVASLYTALRSKPSCWTSSSHAQFPGSPLLLHLLSSTITMALGYHPSPIPQIRQSFIDEDICFQIDQLGDLRDPQDLCKILEVAYHAYEANSMEKWRGWPWNFALNSMKEQTSKHTCILEHSSLRVSITGGEDFQRMLTSEFQQHLLDRVRLHAQFVQSYWLAPEVELYREIEWKLSEVWRLIRSDEGPNIDVTNNEDQGGFPPGDTAVDLTPIPILWIGNEAALPNPNPNPNPNLVPDVDSLTPLASSLWGLAVSNSPGLQNNWRYCDVVAGLLLPSRWWRLKALTSHSSHPPGAHLWVTHTGKGPRTTRKDDEKRHTRRRWSTFRENGGIW